MPASVLSRAGPRLALVAACAAAAIYWWWYGALPSTLPSTLSATAPSAERGPAAPEAELQTAPLVTPVASDDTVGGQSREREGSEAAAAIDSLATVIQLTGEPERIGGVGVAIIWHVDPAESNALAATLETDANGRAAASIERQADRAPPRWADLAFPTNGLVAAPLRGDGGTTTLPIVLQSFLEVELVEADGGALREPASLQVRVPTARSPGERWHDIATVRGRGRIAVEFGGLALSVRARTASGRTAAADLQGAVEPGAVASCRLMFGWDRAVLARLLLPDGTPAAGMALEIQFADTGRPLGPGPVITEGDGSLRLFVPERELRGRGEIALLLHERPPAAAPARAPNAATVRFMSHIAAVGGDVGTVTLAHAPLVAAGRVDDHNAEPKAGQLVVLEVGRLEGGKGGGELIFRPLCTTRTGADGTFSVHRLLPLFAALRLRASDRTTVVQPVQVGDATVRLDLPKPRAPFRRR